ncbi:rRNA methyltransferase [Polaribacter pacificus]|uniref:rRNA methyltransferase n=1 Tax=Polaribacter pacificus TaxID=1775173 RepID=A0A917I069_9FLAO|nr:RNA methyltransferase [Polaribacter pacificus]GGG98997.1 rRNA methyltransferase [Polaribacter pacificus]
MSKQILSIQNPVIKSLLKLQEKSRERKKSGRFIIEGIREIEMAKLAGYEFETLLFYPDQLTELEASKHRTEQTELIEISKDIYQKIAYRETTEGIIAIAKTKTFALADIQFKTSTPLVLVAEAPEKPGNIGALLRTADAANVDAVFIANPKTDLYNPNIIRSSVGCLFTNQIGIGTTEEIVAFLKEHNIHLYATTLQNSNRYDTEDYTAPTAIAVGTEATGLSEAFRKAATQNINIPMQGAIDSMNVSVAAAIVIFEAKRQRGFK